MIEIMTWNTALTENSRYIKEIIDYIRVFLERENSIAFLQQIPYRAKGFGEPTNEFRAIQEAFSSSKGYNFYANYGFNGGRIFMMTVAVTKIPTGFLKTGACTLYPNFTPTNREIAVEAFGLSILGIHAKNASCNAEYLSSLNGNADVILGDFNAGDYPESENRELFSTILKSHVCICNVPTKNIINRNGSLIRRSCIDHIFVKRELITRCSYAAVKSKTELSDHYPVTFSIT